jgi:glutamate N-acetyltransferase/amino-acid N-acetyltransferase
VAKDGEVDPDYREELGAAYMRAPEIAITVDVGVGRDQATVWTCDLTKDYIAINADYRS